MTLFWLVVPLALVVGAVGLVLTVRSLDEARRGLQHQVVALAESRAALGAVQQRIAATRAAAETRTRR